MTSEKVLNAAKLLYEDEICGEPLTEKTPIYCFSKGVDWLNVENQINFKKSLNDLKIVKEILVSKGLQSEWLEIVNAMRCCAGLEELNLDRWT